MKNKRIIIVGKAASGKDTLAERYSLRGFRKAVSFTTRPIRNGEIHGETYHYINESAFKNLIELNVIHIYEIYNGWYYGLTDLIIKGAQVLIFTPSMVSKLSTKLRSTSFIIYLDIPEDIRRSRLEQRNDADIVTRRLNSDEIDFKEFNDFDVRITNENF